MSDIANGKIYEELYELIPSSDTAEHIYDLVNDYGGCLRYESNQVISEMVKSAKIAEEALRNSQLVASNYLKQCEQKDKTIRATSQAIRDVAILRQAMGTEFHRLWELHNSAILQQYPDLDFEELARVLPVNRRHLVHKNNGIKYALCILSEYCHETDRDVCQFYLNLNNSFHPEATHKEIRESIKHLKQMVGQGILPPHYMKVGITCPTEILNKVEKLVD